MSVRPRMSLTLSLQLTKALAAPLNKPAGGDKIAPGMAPGWRLDDWLLAGEVGARRVFMG